jgi:regulator of sirC expression with transglutaminase-like and TPR domain
LSVRDLIEEMRRELRDEDVSPARSAEILQRLTALLGNVLGEIREADMAYAHVLLTHLDSEEAANRARIRAQTTPEYSRAREAKDTHAVVMEMIRSLKIVLKAQTEEMRMTR